MRHTRGQTVTVDAEVHISEFDDDVILDAAIDAVRRHKTMQKPSHPDQTQYWDETQKLVERLAAVLGIEVRTDLPPASMAATITDPSGLLALYQSGKYRGIPHG